MSFPSKDERNSCWNSRDEYWKCLDENASRKDVPDPCLELRKLYETKCPSTWIKYFDRRHKYLKFKDKMEKEGYEPIETLK
ncbi:cytochrome c oxidase assembly factor 6 homolog [Chrysoperla carnea]|uniref:cytochrome c oxidase assembly factor 6 homolog n=1 Tax=Chrysoperla carnea TaxID=189513 RepID=UPI001D06F061|nr:cytochrome c oxidase assembly factor 6 homolog [Chrysoperla carnea]